MTDTTPADDLVRRLRDWGRHMPTADVAPLLFDAADALEQARAASQPARHEHERGAPLTADCDNWCRSKHDAFTRSLERTLNEASQPAQEPVTFRVALDRFMQERDEFRLDEGQWLTTPGGSVIDPDVQPEIVHIDTLHHFFEAVRYTLAAAAPHADDEAVRLLREAHEKNVSPDWLRRVAAYLAKAKR